jgi:uncharacterized protein (DUF302 family)
MGTYGFGVTVAVPPEEAVARITEALKTEGFGVLTEIDVQQTLKQKLGQEMPPYRILGACNPMLAHQALEREPEIGLLLPCNVVVRAVDGQTRVEIADPQAMLGVAGNPALEPIAAEARARLERALQAFAAAVQAAETRR